MFKWLTSERRWIFIAGAIAGLIIVSIMKSKTARDLAVKFLANAIILKDKLLENLTNIREEADDIVTDAKLAAKDDCEFGCECDDEPESVEV